MIEYTHIQSSPSISWSINHGMNAYPVSDAIITLDGTRQKILPDMVEYVDSDNLLIRFSQPQAGTVRMVGRSISPLLN